MNEQNTNPKINADICYCRTFHIEAQGGLSKVNTYIKEALAHLIEKYDGIAFSDGEQENTIFRDIKIAQEFLHGNGLPFQTERVILNSFRLSHSTLPIAGNTVMVCAYPELGIMSIMLNLSLQGATTEQMVFLRHMSGNAEELTHTEKNGKQAQLTISQIFSEISGSLGSELQPSKSAYSVEIRSFGEYTDSSLLKEQEANRLYGILTGDEGWRFVPQELALQRLSENSWSSRSHFLFSAFSSNFLLINLLESPDAKNYLSSQKGFFGEYYGEMNPYFTMQPAFSCVAHGVLFATETGMVIQSFSQSILDRQGLYTEHRQRSFRQSIMELKSFRRQIILTLNRVEDLQISEIGELQVIVLESLKINPVIDRLKYLLELMESEMDLMYSTRTNALVNLIAVLGLIFSLVQVLGMFIEF